MRSIGHDTFGAPEQVLTTREVPAPEAVPDRSWCARSWRRSTTTTWSP